VAPEGCHTVSIEISIDPGKAVTDNLAQEAESALARIGFLKPENIETRMVSILNPAYVVFNHSRRRSVALLRRFFSKNDVRLAGRWAEWKYSAMEDAILDGMAAARYLLDSGDR